MYLNPERMTLPRRLRLMMWLWENGADGAIFRAPVVVRGNVATFTELKLDAARKPVRDGRGYVTRVRCIRVRTPLRLSGVSPS